MKICNVDQKSRAFTLIELLVVVAIIALLVSILVPAIAEAQHQAKVLSCATRLHGFSLGLNFWAVDDPEGNYPPNPLYFHRIYSYGDPIFAAKGFPDRDSFNIAFSERVTGGEGYILWCPFTVEQYYGDWMMDPPYFDPRWPGIFNTGMNSMILYMRTAAATNSAWDWTHSGNSQTDEAPMKPGQAADAVVVENMGGDVGLPLFGAPHHGSGWVDFRASPYTENNVAYGDGHAETHHHKFDESLPWPYWTGEYVVWPGYVGYLY